MNPYDVTREGPHREGQCSACGIIIEGVEALQYCRRCSRRLDAACCYDGTCLYCWASLYAWTLVPNSKIDMLVSALLLHPRETLTDSVVITNIKVPIYLSLRHVPANSIIVHSTARQSRSFSYALYDCSYRILPEPAPYNHPGLGYQEALPGRNVLGGDVTRCVAIAMALVARWVVDRMPAIPSRPIEAST